VHRPSVASVSGKMRRTAVHPLQLARLNLPVIIHTNPWNILSDISCKSCLVC